MSFIVVLLFPDGEMAPVELAARPYVGESIRWLRDVPASEWVITKIWQDVNPGTPPSPLHVEVERASMFG